MRWSAEDWVCDLITEQELTHSDLKVLLRLARHANSKTLKAWPSEDTLAEELSISRKTVSRAVQKFRKDGILSITKEPASIGYTHNVYKLNVHPHYVETVYKYGRPEPELHFNNDVEFSRELYEDYPKLEWEV